MEVTLWNALIFGQKLYWCNDTFHHHKLTLLVFFDNDDPMGALFAKGLALSTAHTTSVRLQNLPWYKTGLVSGQVLHLLSKLQNRIWPKTGQYKTCLVSNTMIDCVYINIYIYSYIYMYFLYTFNIYKENICIYIYIHTINLSIWYYAGFVLTRFGTNPVL